MPDFAKDFVVECDASSHGFDAVLIQDAHPIAFFSRPIASCHSSLAAYERELIGLVHAIRHWRPYLWDRRFLVKTDHYSLKYLLDQRLATIPQHHWVGKLLGFDFTVEYKPGAANVVADTLSRRDTDEGSIIAISGPRFDFVSRLRQAQDTDQLSSPSGMNSARGLVAPRGCSSMAWFSSGGVSTSRRRPRWSRRSWWPFTRTGTKASNARFIDYAVIFTSLTCISWCRILCVPA